MKTESIVNIIRIAVLAFVIIAGAMIIVQAVTNPANISFGY